MLNNTCFLLVIRRFKYFVLEFIWIFAFLILHAIADKLSEQIFFFLILSVPNQSTPNKKDKNIYSRIYSVFYIWVNTVMRFASRQHITFYQKSGKSGFLKVILRINLFKNLFYMGWEEPKWNA
jgi:hypothetical protein